MMKTSPYQWISISLTSTFLKSNLTAELFEKYVVQVVVFVCTFNDLFQPNCKYDDEQLAYFNMPPDERWALIDEWLSEASKTTSYR